ncbi:hypothetical protein [Methanoregula sp.]|jgi:hypothetical protein|uniref:hypothetical protein n=1 Tax=Methanoregula sp. TaxID=2052170 RepID=UPI003C7430C3
MDIVDFFSFFTVIFALAIIILAVLIATCNDRGYGWLIAITFALVALYNGVRIFYPTGLPRMNSFILLAACISMLYAIWLLYDDTRKASK